LKINSQTKLIGIIGNPVDHSLSPIMHNPVLDRMEFNCVYLPFQVEEAFLAEAISGIRALNLLGVNVTIPFKQLVVKYLDKLSPEAQACGAVNLIKNENGCLTGYNTDGKGFMASLNEYGVESFMNVVMLGAGGAAYSVAFELVQAGCGNLAILDIDKNKANQLADFINQLGTCNPVGIEFGEEAFAKYCGTADLIINCTPVGMHPHVDQSPVKSLIGVNAAAVVYDLIYNPITTSLLTMAQALGLRTINGLSMLIHQGALTLEILTGIKPPLEYMKEVVSYSIQKH